MQLSRKMVRGELFAVLLGDSINTNLKNCYYFKKSIFWDSVDCYNK